MSDFFSYDVIAQAVGLIASAFVIGSFTQKSDKRFKLIIMVGALTFSIHFILLHTYLAAAVAVLNAIRTGLSMKFHNSNYIMTLFIVLYLTLSFFIYEKPYDLLPVFSGILSTVALYKFSGLKMRISFFFSEGAWLIFSILVKSIGGLITNVFVLSANSITTYRLLKQNETPS